MRKISVTLLASAVLAASIGGSVQAAPGDVLRTLNVPSHDASVAVDCDGNVYFSSSQPNTLYKCDANGGNLSSIPLPWIAGELAYDRASGLMWTTRVYSNPMEVYTLDPANGNTVLQFTAPQMDPNHISDGAALDTDGTIWLSSEGYGGQTEYHYRMSDGTFLGTLTILDAGGQPFPNGDNISGICIGSGNRMYVVVHEAGLIGWVNKTTGIWGGLLASGYTNGAEGLECDPLNFGPTVALWLDASATQLVALEVDPGTCVVCGATPTERSTWGGIKALYR